MRGTEPVQTIIDELLREQQLLTPVARFARRDQHAAGFDRAHLYRDLIPLTAPGAGEQYGFEVDLDLCSGCKACVTACHNLNGLTEDETWRSVGLVHFESGGETRAQSITAACHHCIDPACLNGCPVDAYQKHPVTGIVRHLDDQCIGCQYCVLKCPYEVPRYNGPRGIVRKCDMCSDRLAVGEAPACVQACPNEAISITVVNSMAVRARYAKTDDFLPDAPPSRIALPSTQYISRKDTLKREHGVSSPARVEHAHPALAWMLVLTQLAVGALCAAAFARMSGAGSHPLVTNFAAAALFFGLIASVFHLGRPLYAFRAIVGWRHSWLSREVLAFGILSACALLQLALPQSALIGWLTMMCGLTALMCSTMIYHDTRRPFWTGLNTAGKFFGTAILFAAVIAWIGDKNGLAAAGVVLIAGTKLAWEYRLTRNPGLARSRAVMWGQLKRVTLLRFALGIGGGVIGPLLAIVGWRSAAVVVGGFVLCFCGELAERHLFFAAAAPPKMPGS
jgi:Fe-S-cluster-containing dehydrogenase component/DMSO reductase anchor subunit